MPTGVAIQQVRARLFDAAERVLLRAGPAGLTSRAVTTEADCAKGVLHRHFADFDAFLAELVADRIERLGGQATTLREAAGAGTVVENVTQALIEVFGPVARSILGLLSYRDELRTRLRHDQPSGVPLLAEATRMLAGYLAAERERGRVAADAEIDTLALMLVGTAHMLFAGELGAVPDTGAVREVVAMTLVGVLREQ